MKLGARYGSAGWYAPQIRAINFNEQCVALFNGKPPQAGGIRTNGSGIHFFQMREWPRENNAVSEKKSVC